MLKRNFDPHRPHNYVRYGRMSSESQNPRSPDQQFDNIELIRRTLGHRWVWIQDYRDDAISGRYTSKRPGFQQMLNDLRSGRVKADLILVDTYERFGRAEEINSIRQQLQSRQKILVLTADSNFNDPTSIAGRALAAIEGIRSTEDGRIKAHNVLRGKRDLASRKYWPGAPVPLGFQLRAHLVDRSGLQEIVGHTLVPNPVTRMVPPKIFALALEKGWGVRRIARALNDDPSIPPEVKPVTEQQVRVCQMNTLCMGVLTYGRHCTGIVNDRVVRERVEPGEELIVEGFCEPLVSREVFEAVGELRRARHRAPVPKSRGACELIDGDPAESMPEARKYLLTGLVRCGDCGGMMALSSTKSWNKRPDWSYQYYRCRNQATGQCGNRPGVREEVLRKLVVAKLRWRLFPPPAAGQEPSWLAELAGEVRRQIETMTQGEGDPRPALTEELKRLDGQSRGWLQSLGNADLPLSTRASLEELLAGAAGRRGEVARQLADLEATRATLDTVLDEEAVIERLRHLEGVLASGNIATGNRELKRVIERVACHSDGRVELRTRRQGLFEGLTTWIHQAPTIEGRPGMAKRQAENDGKLYWTDPIEYSKPKHAPRRSWALDHATEVLTKHRETNWNAARLAEHFKKNRGTIVRALKLVKSELPPAT